jgi:hypothetical protein
MWLYPGESGWHFITLPVDIAAHITAGDDVGVRLVVNNP